MLEWRKSFCINWCFVTWQWCTFGWDYWTCKTRYSPHRLPRKASWSTKMGLLSTIYRDNFGSVQLQFCTKEIELQSEWMNKCTSTKFRIIYCDKPILVLFTREFHMILTWEITVWDPMTALAQSGMTQIVMNRTKCFANSTVIISIIW